MAADIEAVANWRSKQVISWFKGLDDGLQCYIPNLEEASITGAQLLALNYEDLNNLGIIPIGHQELVLEATELVKQLHFHLDTENLQSRALDLNCRCRTLRSSISSRRRNDTDAAAVLQRGSTISLLRLACDVLDSSKLLVMWLDRPPFFSNPEARKVRANTVKLSYELSTTVQQTVFACVIEDAVTSICSEMEVLTNQLIVSNDPMTIQPASLEVAHLVNRDPSSGLGLFIKATFEGHHVITGTKEGSISSRIRRISPGDEVVAVGGQTVVGWQLSKLVTALKDSPHDISITLKKRPNFSTNAASVTPTSRRATQERVLTVPPPISPIQKVADSRKNSVEDAVDDSIGPISDLSRHTSQENVFSPKKSGGKGKKKLKKQKAKSSSNILATAAESKKKSANRTSVHSYGSSMEGSLRSASSSEAMLSVSTSNLTKNIDIRKSLEKVLRRERPDSADHYPHEPKHKKSSESDDKPKHKKGKTDRRKQKQETMPNVNDLLEELRSRRLKKQSASRDENLEKKDTQSSEIEKEKQEPNVNAMEPPSSPLEFLTIPPPPEAPYTPRDENVLQISTDELSFLSTSNLNHSASESPNSILDIEHRRRFTVIGSEQMDEKWFNSLLSEVNKKRSRIGKKASARQVLERLDETTASEDSVFTSRSRLGEVETPVKMRPPKPKRRNRPVSMPPNYYSPSKLSQYRIPQVSEGLRSGNLLKMTPGDASSLQNSKISPIAHQVDANGVRKLAPLNFSLENITPGASSVKTNSLESRSSLAKDSTILNTNNNNSVERSSLSRRKTPPKPPRRSLSITEKTTQPPYERTEAKMPIGRVKETGQRLKLNLNAQRPRSASEEPYNGLLQVKTSGNSTPNEPTKAFKRNRSRTDITSEAQTPTQIAVANELNKFFLRKKGGVSTSSDPFSPAAIPSPMWTDSDAFLPKSQPPSARSARKSPVPLMPPIAKPRSKPPTPNKPTSISPLKKDNGNLPKDNRKSRSKSVDSSEVLKTLVADEPVRRKSESGNAPPERSDSQLSQKSTSSTSRGSYVAAMDGGFALEKMKIQEEEKDGYRRDSDGYTVKIVDGVKVRLRKSAAKPNSRKKGRLKIVDQLKANPDMRSQRRISCRDLGSGECDGWLWKKKHSGSPLSSKWSKRWVVLKDGALYCYHTEEDEKAESYISMPGYQVTPAPECKRKFAFRAMHPLRKTFYFASDRQMDMSRWMNKMGLAAIGYGFSRTANNSSGESSNQPTEDQNYFSESESEDASISQSESGHNTSQSGTESSTPSSSPEKVYKLGAKAQYTTANSNYHSAPRHKATQPDLNRSARFPKNKAAELKAASSSTQTTDSLQKNARNRSKSEATVSNKTKMNNELHTSISAASLSTQDSQSESPGSVAPRKKPAVTAYQRKHKASDARRIQFLETSHLSTSLETVHSTIPHSLRSSHSEEELQHLKRVAAKKAEEVAQREKRSSSSSLASSTSLENLQANVGKSKKSPNASPGKISRKSPEPNDGSRSPSGQSRMMRRDIAGRPKLKVDNLQQSSESTSPTNKTDDSSINELCRALHDAEVDIHGVERRKTLRRKMTILSRDPRKNDLMLKKRALERQIKALEGELQYYSLLDEKTITSKKINEWINQHPSLVADLGTIRRMSKRRKTIDKDKNDNVKSDLADPPNSPVEKPSAESAVTSTITVPVPAKRGLQSKADSVTQEPELSSENNHQRKHSDSDIPSIHSTLEKQESQDGGYPKARPRSCAVSAHDAIKIKPRSPIQSPTKNSLSPSFSPTRRPYLETDL